MKTIRGGNGLGDSLYVQSVARHLIKQGDKLEVCTSWPDVFRPLDVTIAKFRRARVDIVAHYVQRKQIRETTQFEDCCIQAGISEPVELRLDWQPVKDLVQSRKPVIVIGLPRLPMGRKDGYGRDLLPDCAVIQRTIDVLKGKAFLVQVGSGEPLYKFSGLDLDLANKTTVCDLLDIAYGADGFLGYCSFLIPLAESFDKPLLTVWSSTGLKSSVNFIRTVKPHKLLHKSTSRFVMDNCADSELVVAADELLEQAGNQKEIHRKNSRIGRERSLVA